MSLILIYLEKYPTDTPFRAEEMERDADIMREEEEREEKKRRELIEERKVDWREKVSKEFGEYASSWIDLLFTWKTEEVLFPTKLTSLERKWVHNYVQDNFDDLLQTLSVEKDGSISTSNKKRKKSFVKKSLHVQIKMIIT